MAIVLVFLGGIGGTIGWKCSYCVVESGSMSVIVWLRGPSTLRACFVNVLALCRGGCAFGILRVRSKFPCTVIPFSITIIGWDTGPTAVDSRDAGSSRVPIVPRELLGEVTVNAVATDPLEAREAGTTHPFSITLEVVTIAVLVPAGGGPEG